ncbi:MAG: porin, partial [Rhodobacter sp.]|nr:porin [Rhodobacter sp.]
MKRLLMATTALCLGAGTAAADVALSGSAEMGVAGSKDDSARFHTDVNVKFGLSGTTDGGITFGSAIELAESGDGSPAVDDDDEHGGISVFMK